MDRSVQRGDYHADRPEGQQVVILLAVAPGVPAGVLALLQDEHLTTEVHLLKAHEAKEVGKLVIGTDFTHFLGSV